MENLLSAETWQQSIASLADRFGDTVGGFLPSILAAAFILLP